MTDTAAADYISANLPVLPVPGIPEIRLHKAAPSSRLGRLAAQDDAGFGAPYWAHYWAGGLALARYILDHPETVRDRRVVDLGAGSGLVAIAAAKAGARSVVAVEADPYAIVALRLNAALNQVAIDARHSDVTAIAVPGADILLAGDLFYDNALAARVTAFLDRCLAQGLEALVGDPWRSPLPLPRLGEIARYRVVESGTQAKAAGVFRFS